MRFKLTIEYEGTRYCGWQMQRGENHNKKPKHDSEDKRSAQQASSVQGKLLAACREVFGDVRCELYGAGRTDSGVHASNQVAHLDVKTTLDPRTMRIKLNDALPYDICIKQVSKIHDTFHARYDATARSYVYLIALRRSGLHKKYVWWIKDRLNIEAMAECAELFAGQHDFRSFCHDDPDEKSTVVDMQFVHIHQFGDLLAVHLSANRFLHKMVRRIVGVLVEAGRGNMTTIDIERFLKNETNEPATFTAPPSGLFLDQIYYDNEPVNEDCIPKIIL